MAGKRIRKRRADRSLRRTSTWTAATLVCSVTILLMAAVAFGGEAELAAEPVQRPDAIPLDHAAASWPAPFSVLDEGKAQGRSDAAEGSRQLLEGAAIEMTRALNAAPIAPASDSTCPTEDYAVIWTSFAAKEFTHGGYIPPLVAPSAGDEARVAGAVVCGDSKYAFLGFEAFWTDSGVWLMYPVPQD